MNEVVRRAKIVGAYIISHLRGNQSLTRSFFINSVLVYLLMLPLVGIAAYFTGNNFVWIGLPIFVLVLAWSLFGTVAAAVKVIRFPNPMRTKIYAVGLLVVVGAIVYTTIQDLVRLNIL